MRAPLPLTVVVVLFGLSLAGCLGGGTSDNDDDETSETGPASAAEFLSVQVRADPDVAETWFEPGELLTVEAIAPANAVGNVTYTWAHQPDPYSGNFTTDTLNTGEVEPGASADVTFERPGFYQAAHCGPHPWMKHSVLVLEGYQSPEPVNVYMLDGDIADQDSYRFSPQHITVGVGATVKYVNVGAVMHTAEIAHEGESVPPPTMLPLDNASGPVTLEGSGWRNILVAAEDEAGNTGWGRLDVYVREKFPDYNATSEGTFNTVTDEAVNFTHTFEWSGAVTLEVTVDDPTEALQKIDVQLARKGLDEDPILEEDGVGSGNLTVDIRTPIPRDYVLTVAPDQGLATTFSIRVSVVFDHTPPPRGDELPCPEPHYSLGHC